MHARLGCHTRARARARACARFRTGNRDLARAGASARTCARDFVLVSGDKLFKWMHSNQRCRISNISSVSQ